MSTIIEELKLEKRNALKYAAKQRLAARRGRAVYVRAEHWERIASDIQEQINDLKNEKGIKKHS